MFFHLINIQDLLKYLSNDLIKTQKAYELIYHWDIENGAVLLGQSEGLVHSIDSVSDIIVNKSNRH